MDIIGILGSVVSGGVTGVLGSALSGVLAYKTKKMELDHAVRMEAEARKTIETEWTMRTKVAEVEGDTKKTVAEYEAFNESIKADKATYSAGIRFDKMRGGWLLAILMASVDFLRGIIRPVTTILFIVITFVIYFSMKNKMDGMTITSEEFLPLFNQVITVILYLATTTVCWWFGARGISKFNK